MDTDKSSMATRATKDYTGFAWSAHARKLQKSLLQAVTLLPVAEEQKRRRKRFLGRVQQKKEVFNRRRWKEERRVGLQKKRINEESSQKQA